jgi:plastocyanin
MTDFAYSPRSLRVRVGEDVTFVNAGKIDHTVADTNAAGSVVSRQIRPRPIAPGGSQRVSFGKPGTVRYLCTFHPTLMSGTISVVR